MELNRNQLSVLRRLALGAQGTVFGVAQALKLEKALVKNLVQQLSDMNLVKQSGENFLKITENGNGIVKCIARNQPYLHLLSNKPAVDEPATAELPLADPEIINTVLLTVSKLPRVISLNKLSEILSLSQHKVGDALDHLVAAGHVTKYDKGGYYIKPAGRRLAEKLAKSEQQPNDSLLALASEATGSEPAAAAAETQQQIEARTDFVLATQQMETIEQAALPDPDEEVIELDIPVEATSFANELDTLAGLLQPEQYPVIDDIADKQRALSGISLIIKPHAPHLVNMLDQLAADLAVICLHQNRRA